MWLKLSPIKDDEANSQFDIDCALGFVTRQWLGNRSSPGHEAEQDQVMIDKEESPAAADDDGDDDSDGGVPLNGADPGTAGDQRRELETGLGEVSSGIDERYAAEQVTKAI